ncbi:phospholipid carrier-dependent glycosyltransferase, partial [archaeon]|nr:phospholipid carrier-dependent glycosyltransferase [archaeon]
MSFFNKNLFKLFIIFLLIFAVFARFDSWNENSRLDLTRAIVDEGRFTIDTYANNTGDRAYYNGHYYSDKFPGASFTAIPPYFVYKYVFGNPPIETNLQNLDPENSYLFMVFFIIFFTSALFSALTVVLVYKVASFFTKKISHKYLAAIAYGLGTIALNNAGLFTDYAISTFFLFFSFYILYESFQNKQFSRKSIIIAGFLLGLAVMTSPLIMFAFLMLGGYLLVKKFFLRCFYYIIPAIVIIIFISFIYNFAIFNSLGAGYSHGDEDVFNAYSKSFSIEDASCWKIYSEGGFLKKSYHDLLNQPRKCELDIFLEYSQGVPFPVSERTSAGDHFKLVEVEDNNYLFQRIYNYNGKNLSYSFKFVQKQENTVVFLYQHSFNS